MDSKEKSKSWFCVLNNPGDCFDGEPPEVAEKALELWYSEHPTRTGAVAYCISADGLHHLHMVLEDSNMARFSTLKKLYPKAHLDPTKGTKEQAEDYIQKKGKFQEKGEQVLYTARFGEIKGNQGARKDFDIIEEMLEDWFTPDWIMDKNFAFRRYDKMIRDDYYRRRFKATPSKRKITVVWHVGESGSGKSYEYVKMQNTLELCDAVYYVTDYEHGFDKYCGQDFLFMDEFRGHMRYSQLLTLLDGYKTQVPCRYSNVYALWNYVAIASILPPEMVYQNMVDKYQQIDTYKQLKRRIDTIVYHWVENGEYKQYEMPMFEYEDYEELKRAALYGTQLTMELPF